MTSERCKASTTHGGGAVPARGSTFSHAPAGPQNALDESHKKASAQRKPLVGQACSLDVGERSGARFGRWRLRKNSKELPAQCGDFGLLSDRLRGPNGLQCQIFCA